MYICMWVITDGNIILGASYQTEEDAEDSCRRVNKDYNAKYYVERRVNPELQELIQSEIKKERARLVEKFKQATEEFYYPAYSEGRFCFEKSMNALANEIAKEDE